MKGTLPKADCLATFLHERGAPKMSFYCSLRVMFPPNLAPRVYFSRSLFFSEIVRRLVWSLFAFHARVVNVATKLNSASTTCVSPSTPTLFFSWFFYFVLCGTFDKLCIVLHNWIDRLKIRIDGNTDWRPGQTAATFPSTVVRFYWTAMSKPFATPILTVLKHLEWVSCRECWMKFKQFATPFKALA